MQYVVESGKQVVGLEVEQLDGRHRVQGVRDEGGALGTCPQARQVKYDLLGEIAEKTQLTRRTCAAILTGINPGDVREVPAEPRAVHHRGRPAHQRAEGGRHRRAPHLRPARQPLRLVDLHREPDHPGPVEGGRQAQEAASTTTSSPTRRSSGRSSSELDVSDEVVVYSKLPRGFFIPTPVGDYNPDWAIAFRDDTRRSSTSTSSPRPRAHSRPSNCGASKKPRSTAPASSSRL